MAASRELAIRSPPPTNWSVSSTKSCECGGSLTPGGRSRLHTGTNAAPIRTGEEPRNTGAQNWSTTVVVGRAAAQYAKPMTAAIAAPAAAHRARARHGIVRPGSMAGEGAPGAGSTRAGSARARFVTWNSGTYVPEG